MAGRGRDQKLRKFVGADVVNVVDDPVRWEGSVPVLHVARHAGLTSAPSQREAQAQDQHHPTASAQGHLVLLAGLLFPVGRRNHHGVSVRVGDPQLSMLSVGIEVDVEDDTRSELARSRDGGVEVIDLEP